MLEHVSAAGDSGTDEPDETDRLEVDNMEVDM